MDRHLSSTDPSSLFVRREGPAPWGVWSVLFAVFIVVGARVLEKVDDARPPEGRFVQLLPAVVDAPALDNLVKLQGDKPDSIVFHSYNWGGYLTWRGWKSQGLRNWIDDRNEVQGQKHIEATFRILAAEGDWQEDLDAAKVRLVCIERGAPLATKLAEQPEEWELCYEDAHAVIFKRTAGPRTGVSASSLRSASGGP